MSGEIDPAVYAALMAANDYGSGPGYIADDENPTQRQDQRLNFLTDLNKYGGFYLNDLMGIAPAPEEPGDAPMAPLGSFQSDLRSTYGGNALISNAFKKIEMGADPFEVSQEIQDMVAADPELQAQLPQTQNFSQFGDPTQTSVSGIQELMTGFAADVARERREGGAAQQQYEQEMAAYNEKADEYDKYYNPQSVLDDMGIDSFDQYVKQSQSSGRYGGRDGRQLASAGTPFQGDPRTAFLPDWVNEANTPTYGSGRSPRGRGRNQATFANPFQGPVDHPDDPLARIFRDPPKSSSVEAPKNRRPTGPAELRGVPARGSGRSTGNTRKRAAKSVNKEQMSNDYYNSLMDKFGKQRYERAGNIKRKSQQQKDNENKLRVMYSLIMGEGA